MTHARKALSLTFFFILVQENYLSVSQACSTFFTSKGRNAPLYILRNAILIARLMLVLCNNKVGKA